MPGDDPNLLFRLLQGEATTEEACLVQEWLEADPSRIAQLFALAETERDLAEVCRERLRLTSPIATQVDRAVAARSSPRGWPVRRSILAAAASMLIAFGWWMFAGSSSAAVARLETLQGEVFLVADGEEKPAQAGMAFAVGQELKTVGKASGATMALADGSRVELGGDTRLSIAAADRRSARRYQIVQGRIAADVRPQTQGSPVVFATPQGEAEVLGTRLTLAVDEGGTLLEVETGSVKLTSLEDRSSVLVSNQQFAVLTPASLPEDPPEPAPLTGRSAPARFTSDGITLVTDTEDGTLIFSDLASGKEKTRWPGDGKIVGRMLTLSPDGQSLVLGGPDGFRIRDVASGELRGFIRFQGGFRIPAFTPDSQFMAVAIRNRVRVFNVRTGKDAALLSHEGFVSALAFAPDHGTLAAARTPNIVLWDWREKNRLGAMETNGKPILKLAFAPDGSTVASSGHENTVTLWDPVARQFRQALPHKRGVRLLAFAPDSATLATASEDDTVFLWDTRTGARKRTLTVPGAKIAFLAFSRDGKTLVAGTQDRSIHRWEVTP